MGPILGAALGTAAGALIGAGGSYASSKAAADYSERAYKHRYQWQVKDMQKAGLNPMLAFSQGAPNVPQPNFHDMGDAASKGGSAGSQIVQQARITNSAVDLNAANAEKARAEATQANTAADVNRAMIPEIAGRTELHGATARELASRIQYQQALLPEITSRIENIKMDTAKKSTEVQKYRAEMRLIASQIGKNESEIRWNDLNFHQKQKLFPLVQSVLQSEAWTKYYGITEAEYRHKFWKDEKEGEDLGDFRWWKSMGTQMGPFSSAGAVAGFLR